MLVKDIFVVQLGDINARSAYIHTSVETSMLDDDTCLLVGDMNATTVYSQLQLEISMLHEDT